MQSYASVILATAFVIVMQILFGTMVMGAVPRVAPEVVSIIADQQSINVSWMMLDCQGRCGNITMYEVHYSVIGDSVNLTVNTSNGDQISLIVDGLEEFTNYIVQVRAYTAEGPGPYSAPMDVQTLEDTPSNSVQNVIISNATDVNDIAVFITWNPPSDRNGVIRYYRVKFMQVTDPLDVDGNDDKRKRNIPLDITIMNEFANITDGSAEPLTYITLSGLVAYRVYNYSIFAATSVGEGPSADGSFLTREDTPLPPTNLTVDITGMARNSTTLLVNWGRPTCDQGILSGYEICYVESSVDNCIINGAKVNITNPHQLSYTINDLLINTNYIVELRGRTRAGLGAPATANGTTDEDAPDPVINIILQFSTYNTTMGIYSITWVPPEPRNGSFYQKLEYSYKSSYTVGPRYSGYFISTQLNETQNKYNFTAFYYTDYIVTLTTVNRKYTINNGGIERSDQSHPAAPTAVRDLRPKFIEFTHESIFIRWDHPEYPNSQLVNYIIYIDQTSKHQSMPLSSNGYERVEVGIVTSYNLTKLKSFTNYSVLITVSSEGVNDAPFEIEVLERTNTTVPDEALTIAPPKTSPPPPTTTTISVVLPPPNQIQSGIVDIYAVIVVWRELLSVDARCRHCQDDMLRSPKDIIASMNNTLPPPYSPMLDTTIYTAAVWNSAASVPDDFIVGDGSVTMRFNGRFYPNERLREGTRYGVFNFIQLESDIPGQPGPLILGDDYLRVASTGITEVVEEEKKGTNGGAISGGVLGPLAAIGVVIFIIYYYLRSDKKKDKSKNSKSQNVIQNVNVETKHL